MVLSIAAVHIHLTEEEIKHLEEPYQPQAVIGHAWLYPSDKLIKALINVS